MRHWVSVERHNLELMAGQRELDIFRGASIQKMEQDALALLHADRIAKSQALAVDGKALVADLPSVRFRFSFLGCFLLGFDLGIGLLFLFLLGCKDGFPLVGGKEEFLVVV